LSATQIATPSDYSTFISAINEMVKQADKKFACKGLVGIGFPGAVNVKDDSINCANVAAIQGRNLAADLGQLLDRAIKFENDANCFLLSECYGGAADNSESALGVTLGTGVGGAVCVNGRILRGFNAFAGEIGHYPVAATMLLKYPDLPRFSCGCGRQMCLETYISGTGLSNLFHYYTGQRLQAAEILEKHRHADKTAGKVVELYLDLLACGLATAVLVLDPQVLVVGGGLSAFPGLNEQLAKRLPEYLLNGVRLPAISHARFGATGGVRGAALLNYQG
jgi:N-acetylglucosamine kinase